MWTARQTVAKMCLTSRSADNSTVYLCLSLHKGACAEGCVHIVAQRCAHCCKGLPDDAWTSACTNFIAACAAMYTYHLWYFTTCKRSAQHLLMLRALQKQQVSRRHVVCANLRGWYFVAISNDNEAAARQAIIADHRVHQKTCRHPRPKHLVDMLPSNECMSVRVRILLILTSIQMAAEKYVRLLYELCVRSMRWSLQTAAPLGVNGNALRLGSSATTCSHHSMDDQGLCKAGMTTMSDM